MPRKSCSSSEPTAPPRPNSPPSKSTLSKLARDSRASNFSRVSASEPLSARLASAMRSSSGASSRSSTSTAPSLRSSAWSRSSSISLASSMSAGTDGRNTEAVSPRRRERTKRPTAWAKNRGVDVDVAYTPTHRRGTSTPSDTMRTATIHRSSDAANSSMRSEAPLSSERITAGRWPVSASSCAAYARASWWSEAITRPPASGTLRRTSLSRWSAARSTDGIHSPAGSSAVRQAEAVMSFVAASPS